MKEFTVRASDKGIRLDKQLFKILSSAGSGFVYKMLRKKNITLNGKKATGNERLVSGDVIRLYLSDETFEKMSKGKQTACIENAPGFDLKPLIIYEDDDVMLINKPSGMLSQQSSSEDVSVNEICIRYLYDKGEADDESLKIFKPSICNRLDRNTSGIVIFAKTYSAARAFAMLLKEHRLSKYYKCFVKGRVTEGLTINGFLVKDGRTNKVRICEENAGSAMHIVTSYRPVEIYSDHTLLEVNLITGKPHQIRAHLSSVTHPVLGDPKYGDPVINGVLKQKYGISSQMLHAYKLSIPEDVPEGIRHLKLKTFEAPLPDEFSKLCTDRI